METLAASLQKYGQLQPGICTQENGNFVLIAGERRLRACERLKIEFRYVLLEEVDEQLGMEIELEENLQRENLTWQEEIEGKYRLHCFLEERFGVTSSGPGAQGHSLEDTAIRLGQSKSLVAADIELAIFLKHLPDVRAAKNKTEAKKIVERVKTTLSRQDALDKALEKKAPLEDVGGFGADEEEEEDRGPIETEEQKRMKRELLHYANHTILGDFREVLKEKFEPETFDIVIYDPPWGVDFNTNSMNRGKKLIYEDELLEKVQLVKDLELIYSRMKPHSVMFMFFGIVHHQMIYDALEECGFVTNRMPLFWYKVGTRSVRNPMVWFGHSYEPIAYARKGTKSIFKQGASDIIAIPNISPKQKDIHASAKSPAIYKELVHRVAAPGDKVLDPTAGSGPLGVACESLRAALELEWFQIEVKEDFRNLALVNLLQGYEAIIGKGQIFDEELEMKKEEKNTDALEARQEIELASDGPKDFLGLTPGTLAWRDWWKDHPEDQEEMLEVAKRGKKE